MVLLALAAVLLLAPTGRPKPEAPVRILIDSIHAHNFLRIAANDDPFSYHRAYGLRRAFRALEVQGVRTQEAGSGRIDDARLAGVRALFINLVSAELPAFSVPEIAAIKRFVLRGGGLFVVTDHSNCYYHATKLAPLMEELGMRVTTETAAERGPLTLGAGNGWFVAVDFAKHPVARGLRAVALQTGGTVDDRWAVARTTARAWGDQWTSHPFGEGDTPGHYGNWKQDPGERAGPLGVVAARTLGQGRIVVVADQNLLGDPFIRYADNGRLWLNAMAWLTREPRLAAAGPFTGTAGPRVAAYEEYRASLWGNSGSKGLFNLFAALGRHVPLCAAADLPEAPDLILFAHDGYDLPDATADAVVDHLRRGNPVVILGSAKAPGSLTRMLAARLGKPKASDESGNRVATYPRGGRVVTLKALEGLRNPRLAPPERKPTEEQRVLVDALLVLLRDEMTRAAAGRPAPR
jgi:hypothetical protein